MQKHAMKFVLFSDKAQTVNYIKNEIEPDNEDECLTELKYIFFTGCELTKHQRLMIDKNCRFISFRSTEY